MAGDRSLFPIIINAGGLSRRMGTPKALLPTPPNNVPLLVHIVDRLSVLSPERTIVVSSDTLLAQQTGLRQRVTFVPDSYPNMGALGGIATGLALCSDWAITLACDLPLINPAILTQLGKLTRESDPASDHPWDAIVPVVNDVLQPLHAIYHRRCLPAIHARLSTGQRRVICFFDDVRVRFVEEDEIRKYGSNLHSFLNVNTPHDWKRALALLACESR